MNKSKYYFLWYKLNNNLEIKMTEINEDHLIKSLKMRSVLHLNSKVSNDENKILVDKKLVNNDFIKNYVSVMSDNPMKDL